MSPAPGGSAPGRPEPPTGELRLGVTALLARRSPALFGFAGHAGASRLWIGASLHRRYQRAAVGSDPGFRAEVALGHGLRLRGWRVELRGRADGVRERPDGSLHLEELKSHRAEVGPSCELREIGRRQAAIYAWMLGAAEGRPVTAELVWLDLAGAEPRREAVPVEPAGVEALVRELLEPFVRDAERERRERPRRRAAAARLRFPHASPRPGQAEVSSAVERALSAGEHLLVEAPTGLGKTAAVLTPALRFALARDKRLVVLTAKRTQRAGVLAVHRALGAGPDAPGLQLAPRRALCANDVIACHEDHCRFARDHHAKLERADAVERLLARGPALASGDVRAVAEPLELCPYELARAAAARAALVVGDYNHLLEPAAALGPFAPGGDARNVVLVIDEVHNLVDRAREAFGARLDAGALREVAERARFGGAPVHRGLEAAFDALADAVREAVVEACGPDTGAPAAALAEIDPEAFRARADAAHAALEATFGYALATGGPDPEDPSWAAGFALRSFERALASAEPGTLLAERREGIARLSLPCLDPAPRLARLFRGCHAVVGVSATLSPLELHRELLGLDPARTGSLSVPSPFPRENRRLVIDPGVGTRADERPGQAPRIARRLAALAAEVPGHTLALFPGFALLEAVAARLPPPARGPARWLAQARGADEAERERLVAALRAPADEARLVLAVAGGVLAEGVDYAGGGLRAVAVVGPCVPPPDPERELLRRAFEERLEDGFARAYALPGMLRVVQAAGRLLRSERDVGVIALLGRRFLEPPYRDALPEDWCDGDPEGCVGDPAAEARGFFADLARA